MRLFVLLRNLILGEPEVGNAVRSLNKAVAKVRAAAAYQTDKAQRQERAAEAAAEAARLATVEATRAEKVGNNLARILEVD
jgi:Sec-independent protein translocase protein TatA